MGYVQIPVPDIAATIDDWTSIRLYRASSRFGSYSLVTTLTLVAGTSVYAYDDTAALITDWYLTEPYNTSTLAVGARSEPFPAAGAPVITRGEIRQRAADYLGLYGHPPREYTFPGPSGTTTAAGTSSTVVCDSFRSTELSSVAYAGATMLITSGSQIGKERQIASLSAGTFTMADAFDSAPGSGVTFEIYTLLSASEWNDCINEGSRDVWLPFRQAVGGVTNQLEYALPYWVEGPGQILNLVTSYGTGRGIRYSGGTGADIEEAAPSGSLLYFAGGLSANSIVTVQGYRHPAPMNADTDALLLGDDQQYLLKLSVAAKAAERVAMSYGGATNDRQYWKQRADLIEATRQGQSNESSPYRTMRNPRQTRMVGVSGGRLR